MVDNLKFDVPILRLLNESETEVLDILIEPHLELYQLAPGKSCDVYYHSVPDNTVPERTLEIARRDDCMVIYPPGDHAPDIVSNGVKLKNQWI
jgi:hypothetical protein